MLTKLEALPSLGQSLLALRERVMSPAAQIAVLFFLGCTVSPRVIAQGGINFDQSSRTSWPRKTRPTERIKGTMKAVGEGEPGALVALIDEFEREHLFSPSNPSHVALRSFAFVAAGRNAEARAAAARAEALMPVKFGVLVDQNACILLARTYFALGLGVEEVRIWRRALDDFPRESERMNSLAWALATNPRKDARNGTEAVELSQKALLRVSRDQVCSTLDTLAAALAECGRWHEAVQHQEKATVMSRREVKDATIRRGYEERLASYRAHKPWREVRSVREQCRRWGAD